MESLSTFDLEYIFLNIRAVSVGEFVEILVTCRDDEETQVKYGLNLTNVEVLFPEGHNNKIMLNDDTGVVMKYPSFDRFVEGQFSDANLGEEEVLNVIAESIDQIFQGEEVYDSSTTSKKEFYNLWKVLLMLKWERFKNFLKLL